MSTSPVKGSYSDNDWESIFPLNPLTSEDSSSPWSDVGSPGPNEIFAPTLSDDFRVSSQVAWLQCSEESGEFAEMPDERQILFYNTISLLAKEGCFEKAQEILFDADEKGVWSQGFENSRSFSYSLLIERILEKGFHSHAFDLYSRALEQLVWKDFPEQQDAAKQLLTQAGFNIF